MTPWNWNFDWEAHRRICGIDETGRTNGIDGMGKTSGSAGAHDLKKKLYLTFDDGPAPRATDQVLDTLDLHSVSATFFVVANRARVQPELMQRIVRAGHSIGNHSLDHSYRAFFSGRKAMKRWIESAEKTLVDLLGQASVGFRPPAGVRTPELHWALRELQIPLVLWKTRFFDTTFEWRAGTAIRSVKQAQSGDIILLHDRQSPDKLPSFIRTLNTYLATAKAEGFEFDVITRKKLEKGPHV